VLIRTGIYPPELRSVNLDSDWIYRRLGPTLLRGTTALITLARASVRGAASAAGAGLSLLVLRHHRADGMFARTLTTGSMVFWVAVLLAAYLLVYYA
jgi:multicomponent Na+:H+ antiporter subunit D